MMRYSLLYPNLTRLYSIGQSVEGRELWVMEISDQPGVHEPGEPEFKYVGNMHGDEIGGRETLLYLMQWLCDTYSTSSETRELVDSLRLHLLPSLNPDGYEVARARKLGTESGYTYLGRYNANGVDLNRNFPDRFDRSRGEIQPETRAVINWLEEYPFVLSANIHNGALVANYPYDNSQSGRNVYTATQDNDIFIHLAQSYANSHPTMPLGTACGDNFPGGITNGAAWYNVDGGMQDYNYLVAGCMELTLELGCEKFPNKSALPQIWEENRRSLLSFMRQVHLGVRGFVRDTGGRGISGARVRVEGRDGTVSTAADGDYWRLLLPGEYELTVSADGYTPNTTSVSIQANEEEEVAQLLLDFVLEGGASHTHSSALLILVLFSFFSLFINLPQ